MGKNQIKLAVTALAFAGLAQAASASLAQGLFMYDSAVGISGAVNVGLINEIGQDTASYNGVVGDYQVMVQGSTIAMGDNPVINLEVAQASTTLAGDVLYIFYSDGLFGPTSGDYNLSTVGFSGIGSASTYAYYTYYGYPLSEDSSLGGSADDESSVTVNASGQNHTGAALYYLTLEDVITGPSVYVLDSDYISTSSVPEPATVLAGASMLLPLVLGAVRSWRKAHTA